MFSSPVTAVKPGWKARRLLVQYACYQQACQPSLGCMPNAPAACSPDHLDARHGQRERCGQCRQTVDADTAGRSLQAYRKCRMCFGLRRSSFCFSQTLNGETRPCPVCFFSEPSFTSHPHGEYFLLPSPRLFSMQHPPGGIKKTGRSFLPVRAACDPP